MTQKTKGVHSQALEYLLTKGYSVIPVGTNKRPLIQWKEYQERLPTEDEVELWWGEEGKYQEAGVGIVTGKISQLTVVDIDVKEEPVTPVESFPATYSVQTRSGGYHLYYDHTDTVDTCADMYEQFPHVDIRNDGGYVVAPPTEGYTTLCTDSPTPFPTDLFINKGKRGGKVGQGSGKRFELAANMAVGKGGRNDAITGVIGSLLATKDERLWETEVWKAVQAVNQTYSPPLPVEELQATFRSIANSEITKREQQLEEAQQGIESPLDEDELIRSRLKGTKSRAYADIANAMFILRNHSQWKNYFYYDTFTKKMMAGDEPLQDTALIDVQVWMQDVMGLRNIADKVIERAVVRRSHENSYNSAVKFFDSLTWDGKSRVDTWIENTYGVEANEYHSKVGANWLIGMAKRITQPGCQFDNVLVIRGDQGARKSTSFRILGEDWHVESDMNVSDKDFLMTISQAAIIEFSEGSTLTKSQTESLKAIITRTKDVFRPPYGRTLQETPRQAVICMTLNQDEFLKDMTGNRRWWIVDMPSGGDVDVQWLEENREQLMAEAYARRYEPVWEVPLEIAEAMQEEFRVETTYEQQAGEWYSGIPQIERDKGVSLKDFEAWLYTSISKDVQISNRNMVYECKEAMKAIGLSSKLKRFDGTRKRLWYPTKRCQIEYRGDF